MSIEERVNYILKLAEIYDADLTKSRLNTYLEVLNDLTMDDLNKAAKVILNNPTVRRMPVPADIRSAAKPALNSKDEAIKRVNLIKEAVKKFGWPEPIKAEQWLGEDVWADVRSIGGWMYICKDPSCNLNDPIIYAQKRDEVKSFVEGNRHGITSDSLRLKSGKDVLNLVSNSIKSIE